MPRKKLNVDVLHFLQCVGVKNLEVIGDEAWFSCPFPGHQHGDTRPSASMNIKTGLWHCLGCHRTGFPMHFVVAHEHVSPMTAMQWLNEAYGQPWQPLGGSMVQELKSRWRPARAPEPVIVNPELSEGLLSRHWVDWWEQYRRWSTFPSPVDSRDAEPWATYMFNRGFLPDTLDEYQVGFDLMTDRVVIPVRDEYGNLIGFKGREYNRKTKVKYLVFGDREGREERFGYRPYEASYVLYLFDTAQPKEDLVVVEGEFNALMMRQHGYPSAVGINSNQVSDHQLNLLRRYCRRVILIFDADNEASRMALANTVELLEPYLRVYITPHHKRDPAEMSREDVDHLVSLATPSTVVRLKEHFQRS